MQALDRWRQMFPVDLVYLWRGKKKKNDFKEKTLSRLRRRVLSQFAEFILWSARLTNRKDLVTQLNPIRKNVRI